MLKVAVLADSETATGYRLAGVEVVQATAETAQAALEKLILSNAYGLLVVDTGLLADPQKATERAMRGRDLPVLLPVPSLADAFSTASVDTKAYMSRLVRETIGFDIKL